MTEKHKRWLDYGVELSMAGTGVVLFVGGIGMFVIGRPWIEGVENILWGTVAGMLAYMTRRNRRQRQVLDGLLAESKRINEALRHQKEATAIAAQGNCPKCDGMLATTISMRCLSCASAYKLAPTPGGVLLVEDEAASGEGITKH